MTASAPLSGVRVLDFTKFLPGPYCTWMLAELGADVIRVEHPRELAKQAEVFGLNGMDAIAERRARDSFARNKRSLLLDPGAAETRDTLLALIHWADILVEDYRPGVMAKMGLGFESLSQVNDQLIYASLTLCGQSGPYRDKPGHDPIALSMSGALSRVGEDPQAPSFPGLPIADLLTGSNAVIGILAALRARDQIGHGQLVDIAMSDSAMPLIAGVLARNPDLNRMPPRDRRRVDCGIWRCADGKFICTTDMEPRYWRLFCEVMGRSDFAPLQLDATRREEIISSIASIFLEHPASTWMQRFAAAGTQAMPIYEIAEALRDPHNLSRGMVVETVGPDGAAIAQIGCPLKFSHTPTAAPRSARAPGADTDEILAMAAARSGLA